MYVCQIEKVGVATEKEESCKTKKNKTLKYNLASSTLSGWVFVVDLPKQILP